MRRKVPDTWWDAVVVGVLMGAAGGVTAALMDGIWSSWSVAHRMFVFVPAWIAGGAVLCLLGRAVHEPRPPTRRTPDGLSPVAPVGHFAHESLEALCDHRTGGARTSAAAHHR